MIRIQRVDRDMFWNVSIGKECVGWCKQNWNSSEKELIVHCAGNNIYARRLTLKDKERVLELVYNELADEAILEEVLYGKSNKTKEDNNQEDKTKEYQAEDYSC